MIAKNSDSFDEFRDSLSDKFYSKGSIFKKRFTQGAYWTSLDKDLANQYFRDETWLFGIKIKDAIKFIDHGFDPNDRSSGIGFTTKNR